MKPSSHIATTEPVSHNLSQEASLITLDDRIRLLRHRPATIWLTGLSASGKSTIARALERRLVEEGKVCYVLDGDNVRRGLNRDLGFTADDRTENIRRIAEVARLFNNAGVIVVTAFISPYRADRQGAREIVGKDLFEEVFVDAPLEVCEQRDPKGLYKKARDGAIANFTGVSAPYEAPEKPDLRVPTQDRTVAECVQRIIERLHDRGILGASEPA